jgi:hypothetical protein
VAIEQALIYYQKRWSREAYNKYFNNVHGLGDFHRQSFDAIRQWLAVVMLAINHLHHRMTFAYSKNILKPLLAGFIRQHRDI